MSNAQWHDDQEEAERMVDEMFARSAEKTVSSARSFKSLEALERRLGEIEGMLMHLDGCVVELQANEDVMAEAVNMLAAAIGYGTIVKRTQGGEHRSTAKHEAMRNLTRLTEEAGGYDRETPPNSAVEEDGG